MRQDDTVPVVVLDLMEQPHSFSGCKVIFTGCQDLRIRVSLAVSLRDLVDIRLQGKDHWFVDRSETLHLVCSDDHSKCLAKPYLVVYKCATVLYDAPCSIFLRAVKRRDPQVLHFKAGEGQVASVILPEHITVECIVV